MMRYFSLLALALLATFALAGVDEDALAWLEKAQAAHGGAALANVRYYQETGITSDESGALAQGLTAKTLLDFTQRRVRIEMYDENGLMLVQQLTPEGAFAWTRQGGEMPLASEQVEELRSAFQQGVFGLREDPATLTRAEVVGEQTWYDQRGTAVAIERDGRRATLLLAADGTLLGESSLSTQLGEFTILYREFREVDGVRVPIRYDSYALGARLFSTEIIDVILDEPLSADVFAVPAPVAAVQIAPEAVAWVRERAIPLASTEAGTGLADLEPLRELIGEARIVALGEQTHGSREFFTVKHRLLEFLASEMGFTIFAIEANMPEAYRLNDYVLTGEGDPTALLAGMGFWTWNTQEVLDMILWMRDFNASGRGPLQFTGFDMQLPDLAAQTVETFVREHDPAYLPELEPLYAQVQRVSAHLSAAEVADLTAETEAVVAYLQANRARYLQTTSAAEVDWAIQNARVVAQAVALASGGIPYRERAMAENITWILEQNPGAKMVIWAHNGHVHKREGWMGHHLAQAYGEAYLAVGFSHYQGRYTAVQLNEGLVEATAGPALPASVDAFLHQAGLPYFVLDLREARTSPAASWLAEERLFRSIGALAVPDSASFAPGVLADDYDLIVFIAETTASRLLR
jgi:erythromycin esterase